MSLQGRGQQTPHTDTTITRIQRSRSQSYHLLSTVPKSVEARFISHIGDCERFCCHLLGYNAVLSTESQLMFRKNISLPSSGLKNKQSKKCEIRIKLH
jgi:hypothetical protein